MRMKMPSMASRIGVKMRRIRPGRGCCLWMTRVLGFCVTVTKALRTCVPFNCVGRLDSCLRDLVVGYQVKSANRRESQEDFSTEAKREAKRGASFFWTAAAFVLSPPLWLVVGC